VSDAAPAARRQPVKEQEIRIAARLPAIGIVVATLISAAAALIAVRLAEIPSGAVLHTLLGVVGTGLLTLGTGFIFYSPRFRPAGDCSTRWMGATLARFMAIPLLCVSIYFSLPEGGQFAVLATVGSYLACLAAETALVAWTVNRSLNDASI
ncbi:MAG: hypothetical protein WCO75_03490, partial [Planctomycetota bacterium]